MGDGFDVAAALRGAGADPERLLDFIGDFAAAFVSPLRPGDGYGEDELRAREALLGFSLPTPLREAYRRFGKRADLTDQQERFLPAGIDEDASMLVFRDENQSCAAWGIPLDTLDHPDPPVMLERGGTWGPYLDRVSLAMVEMVLSEVVIGSRSKVSACEIPEDLALDVLTHYERVDFPAYADWSWDEYTIGWYAAPGRLIRVHESADWYWLWVCGQTEADLQAMLAGIPAEWLG